MKSKSVKSRSSPSKASAAKNPASSEPLAMARALGETMAVTMVIGNSIGPSAMPSSLFNQGQTLSSLIASNFLETTTGSLQRSAYMGAGLVLLFISVLINIVAYVMVTRVLKVKGGAVE